MAIPPNTAAEGRNHGQFQAPSWLLCRNCQHEGAKRSCVANLQNTSTQFASLVGRQRQLVHAGSSVRKRHHLEQIPQGGAVLALCLSDQGPLGNTTHSRTPLFPRRSVYAAASTTASSRTPYPRSAKTSTTEAGPRRWSLRHCSRRSLTIMSRFVIAPNSPFGVKSGTQRSMKADKMSCVELGRAV